MRPLLKSLFSLKCESKEGAQNLQHDLWYIKIATNGQIPKDNSPSYISSLMMKGKSTVTSKIPNLDTQQTASIMPDQHKTNATDTVKCKATPTTDCVTEAMQSPSNTASVQQQPLHVHVIQEFSIPNSTVQPL